MSVLQATRMNLEKFITEAFDLGDEDKKGYLTTQDLKVAMLFLFGYKPSKYEINQLMRCEKLNEDMHQIMTFQTFQSIMSAKLTSEDENQNIRELFCMLDVKCQGYLTFEDIESAFKNVAPKLSQTGILSCFQEMCNHNDAKLSYREFEHVMKS